MLPDVRCEMECRDRALSCMCYQLILGNREGHPLANGRRAGLLPNQAMQVGPLIADEVHAANQQEELDEDAEQQLNLDGEEPPVSIGGLLIVLAFILFAVFAARR